MRHWYLRTPALLLAGLLLASNLIPFVAKTANATDVTPPAWQRGANITPRSAEDFSSESFKASLRGLAATNANAVSFVVYYYQDSVSSTSLRPGWITPSDASLKDAISYAHSLGMQATVKIHADVADNTWRANINPANRDAWFASYQTILLKYGQLAQDSGAEYFCLGQELISMASSKINPTNTDHWRAMIAAVRQVYSGKLTYGANAGLEGFVAELGNVEFWNDLDAIGVSSYVTLADAPGASIEAMQARYAAWEASSVRPVQQRFNKPVILTEMGYRSLHSAYTEPGDWQANGYVDVAMQESAYKAVFNHLATVPYLGGVYLWEWEPYPTAGGPATTSYTPQNKPAEAVLREAYSGVPSQPLRLSASVATSLPAEPGLPISLAATVAASGTSLNDAIVDIEVYDAAGRRVLQSFFEGQLLARDLPRTLTASWTPASVGTYTVKIGVFTAGWQRNLLWNGSAATIIVADRVVSTPTPTPSPSATPVPTPPATPSPTATPTPSPVVSPTPEPTATREPDSANLSVWWPSNGAPVSGVQPFKAVLDGKSLDTYQMFWQVDGDTLNPMENSLVDAPHKEALVNVSGWRWRGFGPYSVTFVAKDAGGAVLAKKTALITVW